jgi:hypothetical protein
LHGRDDPIVLNEGRRTVVIERGNSQNAHVLSSEQRVDKGRNSRPLGQHNETAEQSHDEEYRKQPEFLAHPQEAPEFSQERQHCEILRTGS